VTGINFEVTDMAEESKKPQPKQGSPSVDLSTHPTVELLLGDSDSPKQFVILLGYLGPSKIIDSIRLYTSLEFLSYFEIPRAGIAHTEQSDPRDKNGPTKVFVTPNTSLELVQTSRLSLEASFLQGSIASTYLQSATPTGPVPATVYPALVTQPTHGCQQGFAVAFPFIPPPIHVESGAPCIQSRPPICTRS
jgi:hypothetical protein